MEKNQMQSLWQIIILWGLCLLMPACPPELIALDAACDTAPKQVLEQLAEMSVDMAAAPEYVRMKYDLLKTKASDKAYILHKSDSVMKRVVAYFEKYGTPAEKMEACYYMGSVYRDFAEFSPGCGLVSERNRLW